MKNTGRQSGISLSEKKSIAEMFFGSGTARGNNGNIEQVVQTGKGVIGISGLHAVVGHAGKEYLTGTSLLRLTSPREKFFFGGDTPTATIATPMPVFETSIYGYDTYLRAKMLCNLFDKSRIFQGRRVDRYLISSGIQQTVYIVHLVNTPTHSKGYTHMSSHTTHQVGKCFAPFIRCRDIKIHQFIGTLFTIGTTQFYGISGVSEIDKIYSFDGFSIFYVKTGNYSFC